MIKDRYLTRAIEQDAFRLHKIAFVSGPRQVGKSTLAKQLLKDPNNYFLYDEDSFRKKWIQSPIDSISKRGIGPIVLDEIHKDRTFKKRIKGIYDIHKDTMNMIVTGSSRLDVFRKGSDSLLGRYIPYRLHPFSVSEKSNCISPDEVFKEQKVSNAFDDLFERSGFAEPLLKLSAKEAKRWSRLRLDRLILEDTKDLLNISDMDAFRNLTLLLPQKVGSLFSINSLREDLQKAHGTILRWIKVLEILYHCFLIKPYTKKINRSIQSEPKLYLFDILQIPTEEKSKRLENITALHLLKMCHYWTDLAFGEFDLFYLRNKDAREVDFLVTRDSNPWMMVECKTEELELSSHLIKFNALLKPTYAIQVVYKKKYERFYAQHNIRVVDYEIFLSGLI